MMVDFLSPVQACTSTFIHISVLWLCLTLLPCSHEWKQMGAFVKFYRILHGALLWPYAFHSALLSSFFKRIKLICTDFYWFVLIFCHALMMIFFWIDVVIIILAVTQYFTLNIFQQTKGGSDLVWYSIDRDIFKTESIFL